MSLFRPLALLATLTACAAPAAHDAYAPSDADRAAISAVVQLAFDSIASGDRSEWEAVLLEEGSMTWVSGGDGARQVGTRSFTEHVEGQRAPQQRYLERWWDPIILVDGDLATVWTPYDFYIDGAFSHAGIDAIVLIRTDDGWRIASIAWNVEQEQRADAPPYQAEASPAPEDDAATRPIEVFLVLAQTGQPAELRLRADDAPRFPLSTREEVAAKIAARDATTVRLRHGRDVPVHELDDLSQWLRGLGVESIDYVLAPPPPTNPAPRG